MKYSCSRRALLTALGLGLLASGCGLPAAARSRRVGVLMAASGHSALTEALRRGLRERGYVEGRDLQLEWRFAEQPGRLIVLADELVRLPVELIVAGGDRAADAARQASRAAQVPVVFTDLPNALGPDFRPYNYVESLARPGGNLTGLTTLSTSLWGKRLELLRELLPRLGRVGVLVSLESGPLRHNALFEVALWASQLGVSAQALPHSREPGSLERAFALAAADGVGALLVPGDQQSLAEPERLVALAAQHRLPAIYDSREFVAAGGLLAYGPNLPDLYRRAASYVDQILRGANPAELPVQQPTSFDLAVNLRAAAALGLSLPQALLLQATEVLE